MRGITRGHANRLAAITLMVLTAIAAGIVHSRNLAGDEVEIRRVAATRTGPANPDAERLLVLRSGGILTGRLKLISTGWLVSTGKGHVVIPPEQVLFDADTLTDAYLRMRLQVSEPRVADHLRIAEWCLSHQLQEEAARELRDALAQDGSNETARLMLMRLESQLRQQQAQRDAIADGQGEQDANPSALETKVTILVGDQTDGESDDDVRSLAGLSPATAQQFVASIQPLLQNKCSNARCHGVSSDNTFQLTSIRAGGGRHRIASEKNLAAVLKQVDLDAPAGSPLFKATRGSHAGQTIFNGRYGASQIETLRTWVMTASRELNPAAFRSSDPRLVAGTLNRPAGFSSTTGTRTDNSSLPNQPQRVAASTGTGTDQRDSAFTTDLIDGPASSSKLTDRDADRDADDGATSGQPRTFSPLPHADRSRDTARTTVPDGSPSHLTSFQQVLQDANANLSRKDPFDPEAFNRQFSGRQSTSDR